MPKSTLQPPTLDFDFDLIEAARQGDHKWAKPRSPQAWPCPERVALLILHSKPTEDRGASRGATASDHVECVKLLLPLRGGVSAHPEWIKSAAFKGHMDCLQFFLDAFAEAAVRQAQIAPPEGQKP